MAIAVIVTIISGIDYFIKAKKIIDPLPDQKGNLT